VAVESHEALAPNGDDHLGEAEISIEIMTRVTVKHTLRPANRAQQFRKAFFALEMFQAKIPKAVSHIPHFAVKCREFFQDARPPWV
jgi:hypothetical protein